ncbi:MAG: precorrin-6A/cobalt-precorrin-6A reductase [Cytophagaceae bacterium]|nr:MAG: precorrin-6A/cobalt-precorrin-6A reductase [Cytophagaceae bacterium]
MPTSATLPETAAKTILVFGGTTEGKQVAAWLAGTGYPFWYSTKTQVEISLPANGRARWGAFTAAALVAFCQAERVGCLVHASHPFAEQLHATVAEASQQLGLPVLRLERQYPERLTHPLVQYVAAYEEVIDQLLAANLAPVLALSGVQTIERLRGYWQQRPLFCRVLPRAASVAVARRVGFPVANLLTEWPGAGLAEEVALIQQLGAQAVITKESGESGFLSVKVAAALQAGVPIFIVRRPVLPASFRCLTHPAELLALLPPYLL